VAEESRLKKPDRRRTCRRAHRIGRYWYLYALFSARSTLFARFLSPSQAGKNHARREKIKWLPCQ